MADVVSDVLWAASKLAAAKALPTEKVVTIGPWAMKGLVLLRLRRIH